MATKDWAAPLVAAVVTFAGLLALPDDRHAAGPSEDATATNAPADDGNANLVFPFRLVSVAKQESPVAPPEAVVTRPATVLALVRPVLGEDDLCPLARTSTSGNGTSVDSGHGGTCVGPGLARFTVTPGAYANGGSLQVLVAPEGPRLGEAGHNATRVTLHVFNGRGELIASNGNASEQARLGGRHPPEQLPTGVWYLGANGTVPEGTQPLPAAARALLPQLRGLLTGLPVGGVATTQTDALRALYGTLHVTAQIDELVQAP